VAKGDDLLLWLGVVGFGAVAAATSSETARDWIVDLTKRGRRLTVTELDEDLKVPSYPEQLAAKAMGVLGRPVTPTAYGIARMVRSEEGSGSPTTKRYLVWVLLNDSRALGWAPLKTLTYSTSTVRKGFFGKQITRRYSTARDPYENDLLIAEAVLAEYEAGRPDPTGGAVKFVNKLAFGVQAGTGSYAAVLAKWRADGLEPLNLPGAPDELVFFRRRSSGLVG
jgi:hypothetical protein